MVIPEYVKLKFPVKNGCDITSEFQSRLTETLLAMAGGMQYKDLDDDAKADLGWLFHAGF